MDLRAAGELAIERALIAQARVVAEAGGPGGTRLTVLRSAAPLLLRPTPAGVYVVGGAAGPLGGDQLSLKIEVGPGASLTLRTAAASVALRGPRSVPSLLTIDAAVSDGGQLRWLPEPSVAAAGCDHRLVVRITVGDEARLVWRDELVLGRHGEQPGRFSSTAALDVAGRPLLRQDLRVGDGRHGWDGPAVTGGARAVGSVLVVEPEWGASPPPSAPLSDRAAVMALPGSAVQVAALADDAVGVRRLLDAGMDRVLGPRSLVASSDGRRLADAAAPA